MRLTTVVLTLAFLLTACGGGGGSEAPPGNSPSPPPPGSIGPAGGTVSGPAGTEVAVPAGALSQFVLIEIAQSGNGAPPLPAGYTAVGPMFAFTPHGATFTAPVKVTVPYDPSQVPQGETPVMLKTNASQTGWEPVTGVTFEDDFASANISGFSWILLSRSPPPLEGIALPARYYQFDGINLDNDYITLDGNLENAWTGGDPVPEGEFRETERFGGLPFVPAGRDQFADGEAYSTEDGKTYWVDTEAPTGDLLAQDPERTFLGGQTVLRLDQSYRKNAGNAKLELIITQATLQLADYNGLDPRIAGCPWSGAPENTLEDCNDALFAALEIEVMVIDGSERTREDRSVFKLFQVSRGSVWHWFDKEEPFWDTFHDAPDRHDLTVRYVRPWNDSHFEYVSSANGLEREVRLIEPVHLELDLSGIDTCVDPGNPALCPEFTVRTMVTARAINRRSGESYAVARLRDPVGMDGTVLVGTNVTETNSPLLGEIEFEPPPPPDCQDASDPDAGTIEFSAPSYRVMEFGMLLPKIQVTRTGGTVGNALVTVRSRDGSAVAGTHYHAVEQHLLFPDGDDSPQAITLRPIRNDTNDGNLTLDLEITALPGCARLGDQLQAEVTIVDDEAREVIPEHPSGSLDTTFGEGDGKVDTGSFGGKDSHMIMQPDGKFVIVGGSFVDFVLARFNADGTPDTSFGDLGRITTDVGGGSAIEYARAVARQPDGKLVVAGESALPSGTGVVALVRYHADGTLDESFGDLGRVVASGMAGAARAVAIQPDGRIVVAGSASIPNATTDFADALVARFNADGSVDTSFGMNGVTIFGLTPGTDLLRNLVLLNDGSMIVSGESGILDPDLQGGVAKLTANGALDATFGTGGTVSLAGAHLGYGLALQADGKLLLAGGTAGFPSNFALMRLNADGSTDTSFGNGGAVTVNVSGATVGEGDVARAVAVRPNGQIYVAGKAGSINANFGLARFTGSGALDTTFGTNGVAQVDFNGLVDGAESVILQPDGKIVMGGYATPTSSDGFGLARVNP